MNRVASVAVLFAMSVCLTMAPAADETKSKAAASKAGAAAKKKVARKPRGRVPNNYNQLNLTADQRAKIYSIQATYRERIAALQKQLNELKSQQTKEVEGVLTTEQKKQLETIQAARKRGAKNPKNKSASSAGKTPSK